MVKKFFYFFVIFLLVVGFCIGFSTCKKKLEINEDPEILPIQHGIKTSCAIGYCASIAYTFFNGGDLPDNVILQSQNSGEGTHSAIFVVNIDNNFPLPFNSGVGQITIAGIWGSSGGVITAVFTDFNIIEQEYEFIGIETIPVLEIEDGKIMTLMAEQDIVMGQGNDTLLHLNMSNTMIEIEIDRLASEQSADPYVIAQQNVWFVNVDQKNTASNINDDEYSINGGGQIAKVYSRSGGMLYHALINVKINYLQCNLNPLSGFGFIQNLIVGEDKDLGHLFLDFHDDCDGKAYVELASGKYLMSNHSKVNLNLE